MLGQRQDKFVPHIFIWSNAVNDADVIRWTMAFRGMHAAMLILDWMLDYDLPYATMDFDNPHIFYCFEC